MKLFEITLLRVSKLRWKIPMNRNGTRFQKTAKKKNQKHARARPELACSLPVKFSKQHGKKDTNQQNTNQSKHKLSLLYCDGQKGDAVLNDRNFKF